MKGLLYDVIGIAVIALLISLFIVGSNNGSIQAILTNISQENITKLQSLL